MITSQKVVADNINYMPVMSSATTSRGRGASKSDELRIPELKPFHGAKGQADDRGADI